MDITKMMSDPDKNGLQLFRSYSSGYGDGGISENKFDVSYTMTAAYAAAETQKLSSAIKAELSKSEEERQALNEKRKAELQKIQNEASALLDEWNVMSSEAFVASFADEISAVPLGLGTKNKWEQRLCEEHTHSFEISNSLYTMFYRIDFGWPVGVVEVSYMLYLNGPVFKGKANRESEYIAQIDNKKFTDMAVAEKYIEGRKKAYAKYFQEENPVVPNEYRAMFQLCGVDIPCYRYES